MNTELEKCDTNNGGTCTAEPKTARRYLRPRHNIVKGEDAFVLKVELPGVPKSELSISLEKDTLTVTGHRGNSAPEGWSRLHTEIPAGDYRLQLQINVPVNESGIKARVEHGILTLTLPLAEEAKPRQIAVQ